MADRVRVTRYDHRSSADVLNLASRLGRTPEGLRPTVVAGLIRCGLMRVPLWLRPFVWWSERRGSSRQAWRLVEERWPGTLQELIGQTIDWMTNGHDKTDPASWGGFNQDEMDTLTILLEEVV